MRQPVLTAVVSFLLACPAAAADPKPNALTEKEIADGWLLLFDGESTFGWTVEGDVVVKDGFLILGGEKKTTAKTTTQMSWGDVALDATWEGKERPTLKRFLGPDLVGPNTKPGTVLAVEGGGGTNPPSEVLVAEVPAGSTLRLRSVRVKPGSFRPLFDGKTLAGWKVNAADPKRAASKFEVTKEGELHVTNGPGDLHIEKTFADFVLQFECKTNGDALNSGVFFRCIPEQYQNGYEAQIQNAFKDGDRTKPADFGTGAIYRRVPARKVVSNDKEWFAMTVIAHGPHISTWVNGYQVVDWTDDRKPDDNPRKGLRTAAGHLSIQGHDPTTDILFRNIRIAEMKAAK